MFGFGWLGSWWFFADGDTRLELGAISLFFVPLSFLEAACPFPFLKESSTFFASSSWTPDSKFLESFLLTGLSFLADADL